MNRLTIIKKIIETDRLLNDDTPTLTLIEYYNRYSTPELISRLSSAEISAQFI